MDHAVPDHVIMTTDSVALPPSLRSILTGAFSLALFVAVQPADGQALRFRHFGVDDGLPSSLVSDLVQDQLGLVWIATGHGVARYDGHRFDNYSAAPGEPGALPREQVDQLTVSPTGTVWAVTEGGISRFRTDRDEFETFHAHQLVPANDDVIVTRLLIDRRGRHWLGTSAGLHLIDTVRWSAQRLPVVASQHDRLAISTLLEDSSGVIWVGTRQGLFVLDQGADRLTPVRTIGSRDLRLPDPWVRDMAIDMQHTMWLATQNGLVELNLQNGRARTHRAGNGVTHLSAGRLSRVWPDRTGAGVWIGTENGGLNFLDRRSSRITAYRQDSRDPSSLQSNSIWAFMQDVNGVLWVGTFSGGLSVSLPYGAAVHGYASVASDPSSLSYNAVAGFGADRDGRVWIATDGGGVNRLDAATGRIQRFSSKQLGIPSEAVLSIEHDRAGAMWVGTWGGGIVRTHMRTGRRQVYNMRTAGLSTDNVYELLVTRDGQIWAGTDDGKVVRVDPARPRLLASFDVTPNGERPSSVLQLREYGDQRFAVALRTGGVVLLDGRTGRITPVGQGQGNTSDVVRSSRALLVDGDSVLWIGTENGLDRVDLRTTRHVHFGVQHGLVSRFVRGIAKDDSGGLWISSDRGITRWDPRTQQARTFTRSDGLTANEFVMRSAYRAPDGVLYFGGNHGFATIDPRRLPPPASQRAVRFTHLELFDKPVRPGEREAPIAQWMPETERVELRPEHRMVTVRFSALAYGAADRISYEYRLVGFNDAWRRIGSRSWVTFSNLSPGSYTLQVRALGENGRWTTMPATLSLVVHPTVVNSWWARLLLSLCVVVAGWRLWSFQQRRQTERALAKQALRDPLTGLANRLLFEERVSSAAARAARANTQVQGPRRQIALLFLDLDNFKFVNDTHGHDAGDDLLKVVASRLLDATRGIDTVARFAGDEFAILLEETSDLEAALVVANRITTSLARPIAVGPVEHPHQAHIGSSIGIAFGNGSQSVAELMRHADLAMYEAKHGGKGRHVIFDPSLRAQAEETRALEQSIPTALRDGQFTLLFQPIVDVATGSCVGAEALLRWRHPERGWIQPDRFVPIAEGSGEIVRIGAWVLREACRAAAYWPEEDASEPLTVSVNISGRQLAHVGLVDDVRHALTSSGLAPGRLLLEITETVMMKNSDRALLVLRELHALGVQIAVDDFGTGYSSLRYLQQFPVDILKVDRSFVEHIADSAHDQAIASMVVALARSLNLRTIAEGVETEAQRERLVELGALWAQGYLFHRPIPSEQLVEWFEHQRAVAAGAALA